MDLKKIAWFSRISFFIVYFWFGILKTIGISPAEELVKHLYFKLHLSFMAFEQFICFFGLYECVIGVLWLIPKFTRVAFVLFIAHLIMTILPIFLLPKDTWANMMTPTLIGQYIIKNLVLIGCALFLYENTWKENKAQGIDL